ncbi:rRNA N6-adenosine-methyltransferase ZCCHC4-like isoform X2 [Amphibalanus amphitrite]|nr:rRNA N6-adenosine-methyltransferase ZCCHC4-like isoform X2 [Amphibalanus amphitrite]
MLLFEKADDCGSKAGRQFYACAACRDRKQCAFFLWRDERLPAEKVRQWRQRAAGESRAASHRQRYDRARTILSGGGAQYCLTCTALVPASAAAEHRSHPTRPADTESARRPTQLLRPRACNKSSAQYLFSPDTVTVLDGVLGAAGVRRVLCCGTPRLHEHLLSAGQRDSLLLDLDERFEEFWPPETFSVYNMFNHHLISEEGHRAYREFVQRDGGRGLAVFVDPPFGARLEALALTLRTIADECGSQPAVFLVLPYFNEPDVLRNLPGLHMTDFRVEYDNHNKYTSAAGGRKFGSPVRLFASVAPQLVTLPEPTYRLCAPCGRWVHADNRHCDRCRSCTSKDGRPYRHCAPCGRCVKVTWQHCAACDRCALPDHPCAGQDRGVNRAVSAPTQPKRPAGHQPKKKPKRRRK